MMETPRGIRLLGWSGGTVVGAFDVDSLDKMMGEIRLGCQCRAALDYLTSRLRLVIRVPDLEGGHSGQHWVVVEDCEYIGVSSGSNEVSK